MPAGLVFLVVALVVAGGIGLFHLDHLPGTFCAFKAVTGIPCMTCGTTRAFGRLFALDLRGALLMNPLAALFALGLVPWGLADLALVPRGRALVLELSPGRPAWPAWARSSSSS